MDLGVSKESDSCIKFYPIYGSGQGVTDSLAIWLVISSTMYDIYEQDATRANFISPDGVHSVLLAILGFVDDVTNQVKTFSDNGITVQQLLHVMKKDIQL
eukprot:4090237-Ditylum_brightwellii.AAC.1